MNKWKITAVVSIILFILVLVLLMLQTNYLIKLEKMINDVQEEREYCSSEVCIDNTGFLYDPIEYKCECYEGNEIVKTEYLI